MGDAGSTSTLETPAVADAEKAREVKGLLDSEELKGLSNLLELTPVQRADVVDEITRKAFVLMEAGEVAEATAHLGRATRIGAAFQKLQELSSDKSQKGKLAVDEDCRTKRN